jgi:hypothetical protein
MAGLKEAVRTAKDKNAEKKGGSALAIRNLEKESTRLFGEGASDEKFAWRNEQRAALGLPAEKRVRGGVAGQYDKGTLLPMLAMGALPLGMMAAGGGTVAGAGGAAPGAGGTAASMGGLPPIPAAGGAAGAAAGSSPWSLGGMAGAAGNWLKDPKNVMGLAAGAYGISQQQKGAGMMNDAYQTDKARWQAGAPLRESGMAGMLNPVPADTSSLAGLASQGNPFARPPQVPGAGSVAGNAAVERPGLQMAPIPATAMRRKV